MSRISRSETWDTGSSAGMAPDLTYCVTELASHQPIGGFFRHVE